MIIPEPDTAEACLEEALYFDDMAKALGPFDPAFEHCAHQRNMLLNRAARLELQEAAASLTQGGETKI
jgi:hypothetical protein